MHFIWTGNWIEDYNHWNQRLNCSITGGRGERRRKGRFAGHKKTKAQNLRNVPLGFHRAEGTSKSVDGLPQPQKHLQNSSGQKSLDRFYQCDFLVPRCWNLPNVWMHRWSLSPLMSWWGTGAKNHQRWSGGSNKNQTMLPFLMTFPKKPNDGHWKKNMEKVVNAKPNKESHCLRMSRLKPPGVGGFRTWRKQPQTTSIITSRLLIWSSSMIHLQLRAKVAELKGHQKSLFWKSTVRIKTQLERFERKKRKSMCSVYVYIYIHVYIYICIPIICIYITSLSSSLCHVPDHFVLCSAALRGHIIISVVEAPSSSENGWTISAATLQRTTAPIRPKKEGIH